MKEDMVSWFYSGLVPDDLVGYGDIEEALDALLAAGAGTPPSAAQAADPGRDGAHTTPDTTRARLPACEPPIQDVPAHG
jgi:hypothetical protein